MKSTKKSASIEAVALGKVYTCTSMEQNEVAPRNSLIETKPFDF